MKRPPGRAFRIPDVLAPSEQKAFFRVVKGPRGRIGRAKNSLRNLAIVSLMLDAGLRVAEVLNLTWNDINLSRGEIHVKGGEGKKDRILWIAGDTLSYVRTLRRQKTNHTERIFCTNSGKPIDSRYVRRLIKSYGQAAGIKKDVHPHMLRHSFATDLLRKTGNLRLLQVALGHADISTTTIYTHIANPELEFAMKNLRRGRR